MGGEISSAAELLAHPIVHDIVIGDFGREATIEYLRLVSAAEMRLIRSILDPLGLPFLDEYRRIMFTVVGDIAFLKALAIAEIGRREGHLTEDVLVGVGAFPMGDQELAERIVFAASQETLAAMARDHDRLRIVIPCNTLSSLGKLLKRMLCSAEELKRISQGFGGGVLELERVAAADITLHTVPETVLSHLAARRGLEERTPLLVLGTRAAHAAYRALAGRHGFEILPVADHEFELVNGAIVAAVGGDEGEIGRSREHVQRHLVEPRRRAHGDLVVLEACTDLQLGLGLSSLALFAEAMVVDAYRV